MYQLQKPCLKVSAQLFKASRLRSFVTQTFTEQQRVPMLWFFSRRSKANMNSGASYTDAKPFSKVCKDLLIWSCSSARRRGASRVQKTKTSLKKQTPVCIGCKSRTDWPVLGADQNPQCLPFFKGWKLLYVCERWSSSWLIGWKASFAKETAFDILLTALFGFQSSDFQLLLLLNFPCWWWLVGCRSMLRGCRGGLRPIIGTWFLTSILEEWTVGATVGGRRPACPHNGSKDTSRDETKDQRHQNCQADPARWQRTHLSGGR